MRFSRALSLYSLLIGMTFLPSATFATPQQVSKVTPSPKNSDYYRTNEGNITLINKTGGIVTLSYGACSGDQGTDCVTRAVINHQYFPGQTLPLFSANRDGTASGRLTFSVSGDPVAAPQKAQMVFKFEKDPTASELTLDAKVSPYYQLKEVTSGPTGLVKSGCDITTRRKSLFDHNERTHYVCTLTLVRAPMKP